MILTVHDELLFEGPAQGSRRCIPKSFASGWKAW